MRSTNQKRRNGIIAAALGAALLLGGSTYALWSQSLDLGGATITAGNLSLTATAGQSSQVFDVTDATLAIDGNTGLVSALASAELAGTQPSNVTLNDVTSATAVDLSKWLMVPGDTIAITYPVTINLSGNNMNADLSVDLSKVTSGDSTGANPFTGTAATEGLTFAAVAYDSNGVSITTMAPTDPTQPMVVQTYAPAAMPVTDAQVTVVLFVTFNSGTDYQYQDDGVTPINTKAIDDLSQSGVVTLAQQVH